MGGRGKRRGGQQSQQGEGRGEHRQRGDEEEAIGLPPDNTTSMTRNTLDDQQGGNVQDEALLTNPANCGTCHRAVRNGQNGLLCDLCDTLFHY